MDRSGANSPDPKYANFNVCFSFSFFTKNVKMKINNPKTFI